MLTFQELRLFANQTENLQNFNLKLNSDKGIMWLIYINGIERDKVNDQKKVINVKKISWYLMLYGFLTINNSVSYKSITSIP